MSARGFALVVAITLAGCAGDPAPRWQTDAVGRLDDYRAQMLAGETRIAPVAFAEALREFKRGGDWEGLAVAQLTRCALERALDLPPAGCDAYRAQAPLGATAQHDAYARWLAGTATADDVAHLPAAYRGVATAALAGDAAALDAQLGAVAAPLSRVVALAVVWRRLPDPLPALEACSRSAGREGWLAVSRSCLARQVEVLRTRGDAAGAAERERRLQLLAP